MHPSHAEGFEWDEANEAELAAHSIAAWEVEEVFLGDPAWARNKRKGSGDWKMVGVTEAGRVLTVVVAVNERTRWLRPITGWGSTPGERRKYRAWRRRGRSGAHE